MVRWPFPAIALAVLMLGGLAEPAWCQPTKAAAASRDLDPGRSTAPDPLTPPEVDKPPPAAPGVPAAPTETAKPPSEIDPIVALVRQRLAHTARRQAGDRDDRAGLAAFYAQHNGEPVWTGKDGFTARATQAMAEIRKADDWGLKASAFDLPALPQGPATPEALAEAEIKLGLAVLKYGRHARGGRGWTPPSVHQPHFRPEARPSTIPRPALRLRQACSRSRRQARRLPARPAIPARHPQALRSGGTCAEAAMLGGAGAATRCPRTQ